LPTVARAQYDPLPGEWSGAINPSGLEPVPVVGYDPATGLMFVDTLGVNRVVNTAGGTAIGGDDVGMISIVVPGPEPLSILLMGWQGTGGAGTDWSGQYFNGKTQLFGITNLDEYLMPIGVTNIAQFPTGLGAADFGEVEMGLNFTAGAPGGVIFGPVQVPEPSALALASVALLALRRLRG
jgi:hypothetical protein